MNTPDISRLATVIVRTSKLAVALAIAWWLLGDTWAHYHKSDDTNIPIRFSLFGTFHDYELWRDIIDD